MAMNLYLQATKARSSRDEERKEGSLMNQKVMRDGTGGNPVALRRLTDWNRLVELGEANNKHFQ